MTSFEMIKYDGQNYPENVPLRIEEISRYVSMGGQGVKNMGDIFPRTIKSTECTVVSYAISSSHVECVVLMSRVALTK